MNYTGELNTKGEACGEGTAIGNTIVYQGTWRDNRPHGISK